MMHELAVEKGRSLGILLTITWLFEREIMVHKGSGRQCASVQRALSLFVMTSRVSNLR